MYLFYNYFIFTKALKGTKTLFTKSARWFFFQVVVPIALLMTHLFKKDKLPIEHSIISINNQLTYSLQLKVAPEELLVLLPHCLQASECAFKITFKIENCRRCGQCPIKDLLSISDKYNIYFYIATGGTLARRILLDKKPKAVIAVACTRDLLSGIIDSYPLPVLGVLNKRPKGPCFETLVDCGQIEENIKFFLGLEDKAG